MANWQFQGAIPSLTDTIREAKVSVLIGLSGQRGAFNQEVVQAVMQNSPSPIIFALSNPTANCEAIPEDVFAWSEGQALIATGSPFPDVFLMVSSAPLVRATMPLSFPVWVWA
ncbi:MAG: malic enzyme-like NAD(P)-binding protein [Deinococcales bacterium]